MAPVSASECPAPGRRPQLGWATWLAVGMAGLYVACFGGLSILKYDTFHSKSFDLAIEAHMAWALRHGGFHETFTGQPWFAFHFEPIMLPVALIDGLLPVGRGLLLIQTIALALAAVPAWQMGRRLLGDWGAVLGAAAVLFHPAIGGANLWEFHPVTLAVAPGLALLDALDRQSPRWWWWALLVLACREDGLWFVALAL